MKKIVFTSIIFIAGIILSSSYAQIGGNAVYNGNTSYQVSAAGIDLTLNSYNDQFSNQLEANIMINCKASSYVAIFSISQHGKTIEETESAMQNRLEVFKTLLTQKNIDPRQLFVDPVSLVPVYEVEVSEKKFTKTLNEIPAGFEMKKNVHITFTNHEQINQLIAIAAHAAIYDLVKVDYVIQDLDVVLNQLRQEALKILLIKKETLEKAGMHIRFSQFGEKYGSAYPIERYIQYYAFKNCAWPTINTTYKKGQPQQQVQYNYAEKDKTIYYEKVSDKQFDKVIDPVVGEPVVQVYLSLKARYQLYDPETEASEKVYMDKMKQLLQKKMELKLKEKEKDIELKSKKISSTK